MVKNNEEQETEYNKIEPKVNTDDIKEEQVPEEERKKQERIVETKVVKRKKGLMERLVGGLAGPDGVKSIGAFVGQDIIVPAFKNIIADSVTSAINMMMFGDSGTRTGGGYRSNSGYSTPKQPRTNYTNRYAPTGTYHQPQQGPKAVNPNTSRMNAVEEYKIVDRREATDVLNKLQFDADTYGTVSVADYYDMIGVPTTWTHNTYGWYIEHLVNVQIRPIRGGYVLNLPPVVHLD